MNNTLKVACEDSKGLIYKISKILLEADLNIEEQSEYVDHSNNKFYLRAEISGSFNQEVLLQSLQEALPKPATIQLKSNQKLPIIILTGKEGHCLGDLLLREYNEESNYQIQAVISNHQDQKPLAEKFNLPFHHVATKIDQRSENEKALEEVLSNYKFGLIVLSKYMQILTSDFIEQCQKNSQQIINIHHSFLPAFIGAKPYHQAYQRGVKIIGATAHYVTPQLDQGPIIHQDTAPVNHHHLPNDLIRIGRNLETSVLAEGLRLHTANRVFISGNKTIVFN